MKITYWQRASAITVSAFLLLGISEGSADAASVSANAEMSWASLQITGTGSVTLYEPTTWTSSWSRAGAYDQWTIPADPYQSSDLRIGIVGTLAEADKVNAFGEAYGLAKTDTVPGERNIIATASAHATNYEDFSAIATAQRDRYYEVKSSGSLTFSINYTLDNISIDAADGYGWADILAFSNLSRWNTTTETWDTIRAGDVTRTKYIEFDDYIYGPKSGTIAFTYTATAGQYLHFGAGVMAKASAMSAVPVPGAVWLLGSGLLGMIAIRRKSSQLNC